MFNTNSDGEENKHELMERQGGPSICLLLKINKYEKPMIIKRLRITAQVDPIRLVEAKQYRNKFVVTDYIANGQDNFCNCKAEAYERFQFSTAIRVRVVMMALQMLQVAPLAPPTSSSSSSSSSYWVQTLPLWFGQRRCHHSRPHLALQHRHSYKRATLLLVAKKDRKLQASSSSSSTTQQDQDDDEEEDEEENDEDESDPDPEDLEYVSQIKRVLELLRKNRDMIFSEVKLTVMIEDLREVERRRLLGIEDPDAPTREELAEVLEEVNEGKIPRNRLALKLLAEEMNQWPNLEVQIKPAKKKPGKSLYARVTDTGIDLQEAAKRLNIDWDTAAEIDDAELSDESEVPPVLGYGALYLVTAFPVIIGVSVASHPLGT
ncbi:hypothetical protein Prudu_011611 [Prunus dulcis]|uniref:Ycf3-interacting protein 1, chloroplastic n=1 Tax=Prunus dulcis TaxID=3755 RepID=A0A4Y1RB37_PRUDU|nr:hypothetical protein Prudu_011611 [Prunus dulcis]